MDADRVKHLELIQAVVTRMAANSFALKGWSITLTTALLALAAKEANQRYVILAFFPSICFWVLDAYYLRQERLFRELFEAAGKSDANVVPLFSMATHLVEDRVEGLRGTMLSPTVAGLHGPVVALITALTIHSALD